MSESDVFNVPLFLADKPNPNKLTQRLENAEKNDFNIYSESSAVKAFWHLSIGIIMGTQYDFHCVPIIAYT
jgi:hypothetical protein